MRTTVDVDADLLERLRVEAARRRVPFKELLNATIRKGLSGAAPGRSVPYVLPVHQMGAVREGINLDKALALSDELESAEIVAELDRRK